jgi:acyl carrier protein
MEPTAPTPQPDPDFARLLPLLVEVTARRDGDGITRATTLGDDLGCDELDRAELSELIEARFGVLLPMAAEESWQTVADALDAIAAAGVAP